jgi:hypothetical protein
MNNRIQELAEQAGMYIVDDEFSTYGKFAEKFAKLIVKECADISDASFHNGSAGYLAILKHFGVEE